MAIIGNALTAGGGSFDEYDGTISGFGTLENTSWADIKIMAASGNAENCWAIGDTKSVIVNGTFGGVTLSNATYYVYILGFNHNQSIEGNGIHFGCFTTMGIGGTNIVFDGFPMTSDGFSNGGWASSYVRNTVAPAFLNCLPTALKNVIVQCKKYTDNTGGGSDSASYVTETYDKIFLLSEFEYYGRRTYGNSYEQNYQGQYAYYAAGNSTVKYNYNATTSVRQYWTRSVQTGTSTNFVMVYTNGNVSATSANTAIGISFAFKVG